MSEDAPDILLQALHELEKKREANPGMDRRSFARVAARGEAELMAIDQTRPQSQPLAAQLRDVGWGGFGFICSLPLEEHSQWRMLFLDGGRQVAQECVVVRHCARVGEGLYLVGSQVCVDNGLIHLLGVDHAKLGG